MTFDPWNFKLLTALLAVSVSLVARGDEATTNKDHELGSVRASRPAPRVYATQNYGLTFKVPPNSYYCPLPEDWVGSDHGTVIFLASPGRCGGNGSTSSARAFEHDVARIEVFYAYDLSEPADDARSIALEQCDAVARSRFLGRDTPICKTTEDGKILLRATAKYEADAPAEATFSLVTTPVRFAADIAVFQALLASTMPCHVEWQQDKGRTKGREIGARCPSGASWF